jgi:hypothetical protein
MNYPESEPPLDQVSDFADSRDSILITMEAIADQTTSRPISPELRRQLTSRPVALPLETFEKLVELARRNAETGVGPTSESDIADALIQQALNQKK